MAPRCADERPLTHGASTSVATRPGAWRVRPPTCCASADDYHVDATALNLHGFYADLERFRGFRHVVRNVYAYVLDPRRVGELVDVLPGTFASVRSQLADFADALEAIAGS